MPTEIIVFVPVLNGGVRELSNFQFRSGVRLSALNDAESIHVQALTTESLSQSDFVSANGARTLQVARGLLWTRSRISEVEPRAVWRETSRLSIVLQNLLWCIYLHPFGENTYWRHLNFESAIYIHTELGGLFNAPRRMPFMFGVPNGEQGTLTGWSAELLRSADALADAIENYRERVPRVALMGQIHRLAASLEVRQN